MNLKPIFTISKPDEQSFLSVKFDKEAKKGDPEKQKSKDKERTESRSKEKRCVLYKALKGESSDAWRTYNTEDCKSKDCYIKR